MNYRPVGPTRLLSLCMAATYALAACGTAAPDSAPQSDGSECIMNEQGTECLSVAPEGERVDPSRASPGAGLGQAIAQEIASSQGGRIEVSSQIGQGTRFTVTLPDSARPVSPRMHPAT